MRDYSIEEASDSDKYQDSNYLNKAENSDITGNIENSNIIKDQNDNKKSNKGKKKYNKKNKSELRKEIQYLEIIDENKKWKYSLKYYDEKRTKVYYNCIDSTCNAKGILTISEDEKVNQKLEDNKDIKQSFELTKDHNIKYNDHNYNKIKTIKKDIDTLSVNQISKKLKDYYYMKDFIKAYIVINKDKNFTQLAILKEIENIWKVKN